MMYKEVKIACESLREHAVEKSNIKKKLKLLTKKQQKSYEGAKSVILVKKIEDKYGKDKNMVKLETIVFIRVNIEVLHIACVIYAGLTKFICKFSVPKEIFIVLHNGSNYDYHFIINELAEEFEVQFTYLGENIEKYITFSVPTEKKVTRIEKKGK